MTSELDRHILVTAPPDAGGVRIDRFLATALEDNAALDVPLSRTRIKALIQSGGLFEADAPQIDPSATVRADIEYRLVLPPVRDATPPLSFNAPCKCRSLWGIRQAVRRVTMLLTF
tara:strand:+ start:133 stop:480 length:348 start_codon:yes stop_codon:yes gene_type:complete